MEPSLTVGLMPRTRATQNPRRDPLYPSLGRNLRLSGYRAVEYNRATTKISGAGAIMNGARIEFAVRVLESAGWSVQVFIWNCSFFDTPAARYNS